MSRPILESKLLVPAHLTPLNALEDFRISFKDREGEELNFSFFDYNEVTDHYEFSRGNLDLIYKHFGHLNIEDRRVSIPMSSNSIAVNGGYGICFNGSLKPNQQPVVDYILANKEFGQIKAPPRWGKTVVMTYLTCKIGLKTLFLSHQVDLSLQALKTFYKFTNVLDVEYEANKKLIGLVENWDDLDKFDICFLPYQKFVSGSNAEEMLAKYKDRFGLVFVDECFEYNTLVWLSDGTKVQIGKLCNQFKNGDEIKVKSYNHKDGIWEDKKVLRVFKKRPNNSQWLRIGLGGSSGILCTPNHGWYKEGFVKVRADELKPGDKIVVSPRASERISYPKAMGDWQKQLILGGLFGDLGSCRTTNRARIKIVHGIKQVEYFNYKLSILHSIVRQGPKVYNTQFSKVGVLQASTLSSVEIREILDRWDQSPEEILLELDERGWAFAFMDNGSSDDRNCGGRLSINRFHPEKAQKICDAFNSYFNSSAHVADYKGSTIVINSEDYHNFCSRVGQFFLPSLRYKLSSNKKAPFVIGFDDSKGYSLEVVKSISKAPIKKTSPYSYNLEVEDNHNYLVGSTGFLVSNCHKASADRYSKIVNSFNSKYRFGVSGTTERKDKMHLITDFTIGPVVAEGEAEQVPCEVRAVKTHVSIGFPNHNPKLFFTKMYTFLAEHEGRNNLLFAYLKSYADAGHCCIAVTDRIKQADHLVKRLVDDGIKAEAFHRQKFKSKNKAREDCLQRCREGETKVLIAYRPMVLGIDLPRFTAFFNLLPTAHPQNYYQEFSRVRTPFPNKEKSYIVDFVDNNQVAEGCFKARKKVYDREGFSISES